MERILYEHVRATTQNDEKPLLYRKKESFLQKPLSVKI